MEMIQSYRVRADRAQQLKNKSFDLSMEAKEHIKETDLISYLIDACLGSIYVENKHINIDIEKLEILLDRPEMEVISDTTLKS